MGRSGIQQERDPPAKALDKAGAIFLCKTNPKSPIQDSEQRSRVPDARPQELNDWPGACGRHPQRCCSSISPCHHDLLTISAASLHFIICNLSKLSEAESLRAQARGSRRSSLAKAQKCATRHSMTFRGSAYLIGSSRHEDVKSTTDLILSDLFDSQPQT